jgi:hypothetical protein
MESVYRAVRNESLHKTNIFGLYKVKQHFFFNNYNFGCNTVSIAYIAVPWYYSRRTLKWKKSNKFILNIPSTRRDKDLELKLDLYSVTQQLSNTSASRGK